MRTTQVNVNYKLFIGGYEAIFGPVLFRYCSVNNVEYVSHS